jgi:hypothetical protein
MRPGRVRVGWPRSGSPCWLAGFRPAGFRPAASWMAACRPVACRLAARWLAACRPVACRLAARWLAACSPAARRPVGPWVAACSPAARRPAACSLARWQPTPGCRPARWQLAGCRPVVGSSEPAPPSGRWPARLAERSMGGGSLVAPVGSPRRGSVRPPVGWARSGGWCPGPRGPRQGGDQRRWWRRWRPRRGARRQRAGGCFARAGKLGVGGGVTSVEGAGRRSRARSPGPWDIPWPDNTRATCSTAPPQ